jgi:hypothetical protein
MRSINLGIMVMQRPTTALKIRLPAHDPTAAAKIARNGSDEWIQLPVNNVDIQTDLTPGQYVLVVDSTLRPSNTEPFVLTTSAVASFWSAKHPDSLMDPRPWQSGSGQRVLALDPKDPWPPLPASSPPSEAALALGSFIASTLGDLLTTNVGRGAAVIPSRQPQRSSAIDRARDL